MDLDFYTKRINEEHWKCQDAAKETFQHAMNAGKILLDVKDALPHGQFGKWLEEHFDGSASCARQYMRCYRAVSTGMVPMPEGDTSLDAIEKALRQLDAEPEPEPEEPAPTAPEPHRGLDSTVTTDHQSTQVTGKPANLADLPLSCA